MPVGPAPIVNEPKLQNNFSPSHRGADFTKQSQPEGGTVRPGPSRFQLVALCQWCHDQTDAPYERGRLVVTARGGERSVRLRRCQEGTQFAHVGKLTRPAPRCAGHERSTLLTATALRQPHTERHPLPKPGPRQSTHRTSSASLSSGDQIPGVGSTEPASDALQREQEPTRGAAAEPISSANREGECQIRLEAAPPPCAYVRRAQSRRARPQTRPAR